MTQEPTPTPDDEIAVIARVLCDLPDTCTLHREKAARIHAALKSRMLENTNTVCVQLPEPTAPDFTGLEWRDSAAGWDVFAYGSTERQGQIQIRTPEFVDPKSAGNLAAALLAAKAKVEASE